MTKLFQILDSFQRQNLVENPRIFGGKYGRLGTDHAVLVRSFGRISPRLFFPIPEMNAWGKTDYSVRKILEKMPL